MDNLTVRTGGVNDIDGMMELALSACADNGLTNPNPSKLLQEIYASLALHHGIVGIIGQEQIEAAILLRIEPMWYSDDPCVVERAIFVRPEFRAAKGGRARVLCEFAKHVSWEMNMPLVIGVLSNERTEAKSRLYARQFGEPAGVYFIYNGKTGQATGVT